LAKEFTAPVVFCPEFRSAVLVYTVWPLANSGLLSYRSSSKLTQQVSTSLGFVSTACGSGRVKRMDSTIELKTHRPPQVVLTHYGRSFAGLM
jgi:hypothetical protein